MPPRGRVERTRAPPRRSAARVVQVPIHHALPPATARRVSRVRTRANRWETFLRARSSRQGVVSLLARLTARAPIPVVFPAAARPFDAHDVIARTRDDARAMTHRRRTLSSSRAVRARRCAREERVALSRRSTTNENTSRHPATRLALDAARAGRRSRGHRSRAGWTLASRAATRARTRRGIDPARVPVVSRPNTIIGNGRILRR